MSDPTTSQLEKIAKHLTGRVVVVRRRIPARAPAVGMASRDEDGRYFVDLHPDLAGAQLLEVFCHEAAHILAGHVERVSTSVEAVSASLPLGIHAGNLAAYQAQEDDADRQAAEWVRWIRGHGGDPLSLLGWWPDNIRAMIDQAVKRGVEQALKNLRR